MRRSNLTARLAMGLVALGLGAPEMTARAAAPRLPQDALPIPLVRQTSDYSCGPAALVAVLRYFQVWDGPEAHLYRLLGTSTDQGTLPEAIAIGARRFGLQASVEQPMTLTQLQSAVRAGKPVILELQAWRDPKGRRDTWLNNWDDGHYVVLTGMDHQFAYFMDPSTDNAYTYLPLQELLSRWHDVNPSRGPRSQHDYHLGIVVAAPSSIARHRGITRRSKLIDRLIRLD